MTSVSALLVLLVLVLNLLSPKLVSEMGGEDKLV